MYMDDHYGPPEHQFANEMDVQQQFRRGIDGIFSRLPRFPNEKDRSYESLHNLKNFQKNHVCWGMYSDGMTTPFEEGQYGEAWMTITHHLSRTAIKENRAVYVSPDYILNKDRGRVWILHILPVKYTETWAGLIGIHELEHLENGFTGKMPPDASRSEYIESEIRAYTAQTETAELISHGHFLQAVDSVIDFYDFKTIRDIRECLLCPRHPTAVLIARTLDTYLTSENPLSPEEAGIRLGTYWMALAFRLAEHRFALQPENIRQQKIEAIELTYGSGYSDVLPEQDE
jgi:hypothetical protein